MNISCHSFIHTHSFYINDGQSFVVQYPCIVKGHVFIPDFSDRPVAYFSSMQVSPPFTWQPPTRYIYPLLSYPCRSIGNGRNSQNILKPYILVY